MSLADVTGEGVLDAIAEFDDLGRQEFLKQTGFGPAREYYLEYDGRLYDSKPIVGRAHHFSAGIMLSPGDFSGGDKTVAQRLTALGFDIRHLPHQNWTRDEIILACELVESNGWHQLDESDRRVQELSALLQSRSNHPDAQRHPDFRNPAGVARKTYNIASVHPSYLGAKSNGSYLDKQVLDEFLDDSSAMHAMATRIRDLFEADNSSTEPVPDLDANDSAATEGGVALRAHLRRERDPRLREKKLKAVKKQGLPIACEVCTFDFGNTYGQHGLDYIECHHRIPLHASGQTQTKLADLALLCSNCHRMIHRGRQWLTVEQLSELVKSHRQ